MLPPDFSGTAPFLDGVGASLLSEVAREYGIPTADATRMLDRLPVGGHRHVLPDQVSEYVRRPEAVGATVSAGPTSARSPRRDVPGVTPFA